MLLAELGPTPEGTAERALALAPGPVPRVQVQRSFNDRGGACLEYRHYQGPPFVGRIYNECSRERNLNAAHFSIAQRCYL